MNILALDPGPTHTAWAHLEDGAIQGTGFLLNDTMLEHLMLAKSDVHLAIEMIASYGMPVGEEVFETCVWIGRYKQAWVDWVDRFNGYVRLVYRKDVKWHICNSTKASDANIRAALIDRFGKPGTAKKPGGTFGITGDMWAALGVAVTASETKERKVVKNATPRGVGKRSASDGKSKRRVSVEAVPVARERVQVGEGGNADPTRRRNRL